MSPRKLQSSAVLLALLVGVFIGGYLQKSALRPVLGLGASAEAPSPAATGISVQTAAPQVVPEATLFAFDNVSIPFHRNLYLSMHQGRKHPQNPIVRREEGRPDEARAQYLGTVIRQQGKFRMWYVAADKASFRDFSTKGVMSGWRVAYAESEDGIHWTKPNLGLVEYAGSLDNNLVLMDPPELSVIAGLSILYEPQDPDPSRRFKMMAAAPAEGTGTTAVPLYSGDGLRWRPARETKLVEKRRGRWLAHRVTTDNLAIPEFLEHAGLYKWRGMYHLAGQQISPWIWLPDGQPCGRVMSIFRSHDFAHWSDTKSLSFVRYGYRSTPTNEGEESHEPASVWNRGNVLLGTYGQFHGVPGSPAHPMDLGLLISNDGVHFREPLPDFAFLPRGEPASWEGGGLLQGQGFENVGEETYIWYGGWDNDVTRPDTYGEIGLARWRRDGFGSLSPKNPEVPAALVTSPIQVDGAARIWVNAEGLSEKAWLRVELLDERERPLSGYSGGDSASVRQSGLRELVSWKGQETIQHPSGAVKMRVSFEGKRKNIKLYALYLGG